MAIIKLLLLRFGTLYHSLSGSPVLSNPSSVPSKPIFSPLSELAPANERLRFDQVLDPFEHLSTLRAISAHIIIIIIHYTLYSHGKTTQ